MTIQDLGSIGGLITAIATIATLFHAYPVDTPTPGGLVDAA